MQVNNSDPYSQDECAPVCSHQQLDEFHGDFQHFSSAESAASFQTAHSNSSRGSPCQQHVEGKQLPSKGRRADPYKVNLNHFHSEAIFDSQISAGQFTMVKHMDKCCRGDGQVELHLWQRGTSNHKKLSVVVKRVNTARVNSTRDAEADEEVIHYQGVHRDMEDTLNEIGLYCMLFQNPDVPEYVLKMYAAFHATNDIWLVLEQADGGDLFGVVKSHREKGSTIPISQSMLWMWQLLQAVGYLHKYYIGHRDISVENVLLRGGDIRLMDFGQAVQTHSVTGELLRYCITVGKPYYRGPESKVPRDRQVRVKTPQDAQPGKLAFARSESGEYFCDVMLPATAVPGQGCLAKPVGYAAAPNDIFSCGVCLFIMATGMPPWEQASLRDHHFAWVNKQGIPKLLRAWKQNVPVPMEDLLSSMLKASPQARATVEACLAHPWLKSWSNNRVPVHFTEALVKQMSPTSAASSVPTSAGSDISRGSSTSSGVSGSSSSAITSSPFADMQPTACSEAALGWTEPWMDVEHHAAMTGSFYEEPEVTRNANVPLSGLLDEESPSSSDFFGDFYCEQVFKQNECPGRTVEEFPDAPKMILQFERQSKQTSLPKSPAATSSKSELRSTVIGLPFATRCLESLAKPHKARSISCGAVGARQAEVDLGSLEGWADPGIRGLLKRKNRQLNNSRQQNNELLVRRPSMPLPIIHSFQTSRRGDNGSGFARRNIRRHGDQEHLVMVG